MNSQKMPCRVLFYCQYLLGIGHVRRSALVVKALQQQGFEVHVIFGGIPVEISFGQATLHYLPPVKTADVHFSGLVHADGRPFTQADQQARSQALLTLAQQIAPHAIVTETYPFGRRMMRFELKPLLKWARQQTPRPLVISSIRDILQQRKPKRRQETLDLVQTYYDHVWVHGDQQLVALQASFPDAERIQDKLAYTGYVCPPAVPRAAQAAGIMVSVGGGSIGYEMMLTALALYKTGFARDKHWSFMAGPHMPAEHYQHLLAQSGERLSVFRLVPDFVERLASAELSISLGGYNTTMDILQSRVPAVIVPFTGGEETEQLQRTLLLDALGVVAYVDSDNLSVASLQQAIEKAWQARPDKPNIEIAGADNAARLLMEWCHDPLD